MVNGKGVYQKHYLQISNYNAGVLNLRVHSLD